MDEASPSPEAHGLPVPGPHEPHPLAGEMGPDLTPLRLVLQPSGATLVLDRPELVVGRHSEADIRLPLPDVSRHHCRFCWAEGCWQVVDLNSLNGVYVNEEQVLQAALHQGDLVRIGGFTFSVDLGDEPLAADEPEPDTPDVVRSIFRLLPRRSQPHRRAS